MPDYVGGFLLDGSRNSVEAARHGKLATEGLVDHLWLRVADLAATREFYESLAPAAGLRTAAREPGLVRYRGPRPGGGSLTFVEDPSRLTAGAAFGLPPVEPGAAAGPRRDPDGNLVTLG